jgi:hypothetical protein
VKETNFRAAHRKREKLECDLVWIGYSLLFQNILKNNNATMVLATMNVDSKREGSPEPSNDGGGSVPSGFILKLFQMVNGAPDEVISVSDIEFLSEALKSSDTSDANRQDGIEVFSMT